MVGELAPTFVNGTLESHPDRGLAADTAPVANETGTATITARAAA